MTADGGFVEIQGTAEGEPFARNAMNSMLDLAASGINELLAKQMQVLAEWVKHILATEGTENTE